MRGLKLPANSGAPAYIVASFTDAWIETSTIAVLTVVTVVASFTDAWIETAVMSRLRDAGLSHLLQMRGLKRFVRLLLTLDARRIFYRCVD